MLIKYLLWISLGLNLFFAHFAKAELLSLQIEPLVGYERVQQLKPSAHTVNRTLYGARLMVGILLISAEAEFTRGELQETYPELTQKTTGDKLKAGLRSGFRLGRFLSTFLRGGIQASQERVDQTENGTTTTTYNPLQYHPYAGAGVKIALTRRFSATGNVVAIIPNINNMNQNDYQISAGFAIRVP